MKTKTSCRRWLAAATLLVLSACGGGTEDAPAPTSLLLGDQVLSISQADLWRTFMEYMAADEPGGIPAEGVGTCARLRVVGYFTTSPGPLTADIVPLRVHLHIKDRDVVSYAPDAQSEIVRFDGTLVINIGACAPAWLQTGDQAVLVYELQIDGHPYFLASQPMLVGEAH